MCRITLSFVACMSLQYFSSHYLTKGMIFRKYLQNTKCAFCFSLKFLSETFLILRRIQRDTIININRSSFKVPVILYRLYSNLNFPYKFSKNLLISNFIKIRPIGAEMFHAARQTDMTKLTVAFPNFAKARNKGNECSYIHFSFTRYISVPIHLNVILIFPYPFSRRTFRRHFLLKILATSPVRYRNIYLNSVPFSVPEHNL